MTSKLHIDRLSVKNFRALDELTLEGLGRVNVFVGRNNSGKTTILDAIELLATGAPLPILLEQLLRITKTKIAESNTQHVDFNFLPLLFTHSQHEIRIASNMSTILVKKQTNQITITESADLGTKKVKERLLFTIRFDALSQSYHPPSQMQAALNPISVFYVPTNLLSSLDLERLWTDIQLTGLEKHVIESLKILDDSVENIAFKQLNLPSPTPIRKPYIRKSNVVEPLPLAVMGDGMSRVLQIILSLLNAKNGILLIDELENGLHYRIQEDLWRMIFTLATELNVQIFVTTHSWDVIESFSKIAIEHPEEGVLYRLGRSRIDGKLNPYRYSEQALQSATQSEMEVR